MQVCDHFIRTNWGHVLLIEFNKNCCEDKWVCPLWDIKFYVRLKPVSGANKMYDQEYSWAQHWPKCTSIRLCSSVFSVCIIMSSCCSKDWNHLKSVESQFDAFRRRNLETEKMCSDTHSPSVFKCVTTQPWIIHVVHVSVSRTATMEMPTARRCVMFVTWRSPLRWWPSLTTRAKFMPRTWDWKRSVPRLRVCSVKCFHWFST